MKIYLTRHGQTNYNELDLCNYDSLVDVHLTQVGIAQANLLAKKLKPVNIDRVFVSELKRTHQTADIINKFHNAPIEIDARLNDNRSGYEGKTTSEYYAALEKVANKWTVVFNDGESLEDVKSRVKSFVEDLKVKNYETVLIVTSKVVVQAFYGLVNGLTNQQAWDLPAKRGSCIELELK